MSNVRTRAMNHRLVRYVVRLCVAFAVASPTGVLAQQVVSVCDESYVKSAQSATELLGFLDRCGDIDFAFALAALKLNQSPPPATRLLSLQPRSGNTNVEQVTLQADVFFNFMLAYPQDFAVRKLDDLLLAVSRGFAVQTANILASADPNEVEFPVIPVAKQRAAMLRRLLVNVGFPADRVFASERAARYPNTLEGRARDRSAEITVVLLRERTP